MSTRVNSRCGLLICIGPDPPAFMLPLRQYPPPRVRDPHPRDLDRLAGGKDTLGRRRREPGAYDADQDIELEAVRGQQGVGAAVFAGGQQLKHAALISGHRVACHASYSARNAALASSSVGAWP